MFSHWFIFNKVIDKFKELDCGMMNLRLVADGLLSTTLYRAARIDPNRCFVRNGHWVEPYPNFNSLMLHTIRNSIYAIWVTVFGILAYIGYVGRRSNRWIMHVALDSSCLCMSLLRSKYYKGTQYYWESSWSPQLRQGLFFRFLF